MSDHTLLRTREVATRLGISISFAKKLVRSGTLPLVRIGTSVRVPAADLDAYIDKHRVPPGHAA